MNQAEEEIADIAQVGRVSVRLASTDEPWFLQVDTLVIPVGSSGNPGDGQLATAFREACGEEWFRVDGAIEGGFKGKRLALETPILVQIPQLKAVPRLRTLILATAFTETDESTTRPDRATSALVELAGRHRVKRMVLPLLGSGAGNASPNRTAVLILRAVAASRPRTIEEIVIVTLSQDVQKWLRAGPNWADLPTDQDGEVDDAIAALPDELWEQDPSAVYAEIRRLIEERRKSTPHAGEEAVSLLASELVSLGLRASAALEEVFRQSALLAIRRRQQNEKLTTTLTVFSAVQLGSAARSGEDWPFLEAFSAAVRETAGTGYETVEGRYFSPETPAKVALPKVLSSNTRSALHRAAENRAPATPEGILGVDVFFLALLQTTGANALSNLDDMGVDPGKLRERLNAPELLGRLWTAPPEASAAADGAVAAGTPGATGPRKRRSKRPQPTPETSALTPSPSRQHSKTEFASDRAETTRDLLRRAPLAFALAAQINRIWDAQIKGEPERSRRRRIADALHISRPAGPSSQADEAAFILHIDAPWGGGKTTFANFIARILNPGAFGLDVASADGASLLKALPLNDDDLWKPAYRKRRWHVVHFNAWQNEHVSPPWWNFYESIRRQCLTGLALASRAPAPKAGEERGTWSAFRLRLGGRAVWLWFALREWLWKLLTPGVWRNLVIFAVLFVIVLVVWNTGWFQTLTAGDTETPRAPQSAGEGDAGATTRAAALGILTVLLTGGAGITVINLVRSGISFVVEGLGGSADATSLGQADPLFRFQRHFSWFVRQLDGPVLVIVDDLDRCKPAYVVELVRGLLTIFRSPRVVFLLLGDKAWIEEAFAHVHGDMSNAHSGAQVTFGGRFAEKAIQLSFILPEASDEERNAYLVAILTGKLPISGTGAGAVDAESFEGAGNAGEVAGMVRTFAAFAKEVRQDLSNAQGTEDLVRLKNEHKGRIGDIIRGAGDGTDKELEERLVQAAKRTVDVEASFRSATSEQTEEDIRHGIEPVAPFLPGNPRRIKRIVNMVSAFQESGQIAEKIDPLSTKWRQLVLWTVVMSEFPQAWRTMVLEREVAREILKLISGADSEGNIKMPAPTKGANDEEKARRPKVLAIAENPVLIRLLRGDPFNAGAPKGENHAIDEASLVWLRRLTPLN